MDRADVNYAVYLFICYRKHLCKRFKYALALFLSPSPLSLFLIVFSTTLRPGQGKTVTVNHVLLCYNWVV